jgi:hypothetical protein
MEQALIWTPRSTKLSKSDGNSCEDKLMCEAGTPARIARCISYPEEASICRPKLLKSLRIAALGLAFIAYRTVKPKALGKERALLALALRVAIS